jgi:DNA-binding PadR family transcriptional regulator
VQHFWPADQSQIYRTLTQLEKDGWVEMEIVVQEDRPNRKVFSITPVGRDELYQWLVNPVPHHDHRSAELIQVFFAGQLQDEEILQIFERTRQKCEGILAAYGQVPEKILPYEEEVDNPREKFFWHLTLELGFMSMRTQLEWIDSVIERLQNQQVPPLSD